jgi:hypothetical protein
MSREELMTDDLGEHRAQLLRAAEILRYRW